MEEILNGPNRRAAYVALIIAQEQRHLSQIAIDYTNFTVGALTHHATAAGVPAGKLELASASPNVHQSISRLLLASGPPTPAQLLQADLAVLALHQQKKPSGMLKACESAGSDPDQLEAVEEEEDVRYAGALLLLTTLSKGSEVSDDLLAARVDVCKSFATPLAGGVALHSRSSAGRAASWARLAATMVSTGRD